MAPYSIEELRNIVSPIARAHGVASVSLFGSYAKGLADAGSDVDLKIDKGALRSLFQLCGFRLAIDDALKLPVDLVTSDSSVNILRHDPERRGGALSKRVTDLFYKKSFSIASVLLTIWSATIMTFPLLSRTISFRTLVVCALSKLAN